MRRGGRRSIIGTCVSSANRDAVDLAFARDLARDLGRVALAISVDTINLLVQRRLRTEALALTQCNSARGGSDPIVAGIRDERHLTNPQTPAAMTPNPELGRPRMVMVDR